MDTRTNSLFPPVTRAFTAANTYLGWGEPKNGIWFVGLEEADGWYDLPEAEVIRRYMELGEVSPASTQVDFAALKAAGRGIRQKTARIMSAVSTSAMCIADVAARWRWYHDNRLWRPGSRSFQANLYPLGKPTRTSWPKAFEPLFGFGPDNRDTYKQVVAETRFKRLHARWLEDAPLATICFGAEAWPDFRAVFRVTSSPRTLANGKIHVHDSERVVLMHFFARWHVTNADADAVGAVLRDEWNVRIP